MAFPKMSISKIKKALPIVFIAIVIVLIGYYLPKGLKQLSSFLSQMPAALQMSVEEKKPEEKLKLEELPPDSDRTAKKGQYAEVAQKGEGITHLARRALKRYLQDHPQNFQVTPEHKIYIEDYIAKSLGERWLKLGEKLEFSEDLIQEALNKAQGLSPAQLQNLTQYVQLVPSLAD